MTAFHPLKRSSENFLLLVACRERPQQELDPLAGETDIEILTMTALPMTTTTLLPSVAADATMIDVSIL